MTHRLTTNCAKNYCNRTLIVKVIVENVVTCFWDSVQVNRLNFGTWFSPDKIVELCHYQMVKEF